MNAEDPLISYIVVTANRCPELVKCLDSIRQQEYGNSELIVVDNHSEDDSAEVVRRDFAEARLICLDHNAGIPGGRNIGMRAAKGDIVVSVDDDAEFPDTDAAQRIVSQFQHDSRLGILALRVVDPYTGVTERATIPRRDKKDVLDETEVTYFPGGAHALRRTMLDETGFYPEHLFYSGEELALSYAALRAGWKILYYPSIQVLHYRVPAGRPKGQRVYYYTRNHIWVPLMYLPMRYAIVQMGLWSGSMMLEAVKQREVGFFFKGLWDALLGIPMNWRLRKPVNRQVIEKLRMLSGRLYY
jgi:GT2 family glycosyltransferase